MSERFGAAAVEEVELRIAELLRHDEPDAVEFWRTVRDLLREMAKGGPRM